MNQLSGRVAIVTGGAKGIGRHYCRTLAENGASLVVADIADPAAAAAELNQSFGSGRAIGVKTDVTSEAQVAALVESTRATFGRIDILVNNAAYLAALPMQPATEWTSDIFEHVMKVNVVGTYLMCKHVMPTMMAQRSGKIINIGSTTIFRGVPMMLPYVTSKGATVALTRALSRELGDYNVCVNTLAPGLTLSESLVAENPEMIEKSNATAVAARALKRDMLPSDLQGALLFLASDASNFMTGQTIVVDGGAANN